VSEPKSRPQDPVLTLGRPHTVLTFVIMEQLRKLTQLSLPSVEEKATVKI
jgi:hypothetical protein